MPGDYKLTMVQFSMIRGWTARAFLVLAEWHEDTEDGPQYQTEHFAGSSEYGIWLKGRPSPASPPSSRGCGGRARRGSR
jgi:hypothetical protein